MKYANGFCDGIAALAGVPSVPSVFKSVKYRPHDNPGAATEARRRAYPSAESSLGWIMTRAIALTRPRIFLEVQPVR